MPLSLVVDVLRGAILESRHRFHAAFCDPDGRLHAATEEPHRVTTLRSSAKPFQLLPLVERGHAERLGCSEEELAVMAASHIGSAYHRALVSGLLGRIGLTADHLACGFHEPVDSEARAEVRSRPELASPLYNNCSGKHTGMLALARAEGWPVEGYTRPDHPVQRLMHRTVAEICRVAPEEMMTGTDDCGVVVFAAPLTVMARGYARLAAAGPNGDERERALDRIRTAMVTYPRAVGGPGRLSTQIMELGGGKILCKGGAEGLECLAFPGRGLGAAIKCVDGSGRGMSAATLALLDHLGLLAGADPERALALRRPLIRNHAGAEVGRLEASLEVLAPSS